MERGLSVMGTGGRLDCSGSREQSSPDLEIKGKITPQQDGLRVTQGPSQVPKRKNSSVRSITPNQNRGGSVRRRESKNYDRTIPIIIFN